jgi:hypothetical protein
VTSRGECRLPTRLWGDEGERLLGKAPGHDARGQLPTEPYGRTGPERREVVQPLGLGGGAQRRESADCEREGRRAITGTRTAALS